MVQNYRAYDEALDFAADTGRELFKPRGVRESIETRRARLYPKAAATPAKASAKTTGEMTADELDQAAGLLYAKAQEKREVETAPTAEQVQAMDDYLNEPAYLAAESGLHEDFF